MPIGSSLPSKSIGPQLPLEYSRNLANEEDEDEDDDSYAPALPPDMLPPARSTFASAPMFIKRPSFPPRPVHDDVDNDDDYGPMPLPTGGSSLLRKDRHDGVREFLEREETRKRNIEVIDESRGLYSRKEAARPKKLKRDDWMLVPPKSSDLLGHLDVTKLKARQFSRSSGDKRESGPSPLWTETPAERQKRIAEEVMGKRKRTEESGIADPAVDEEDIVEERKRRKRDADINKVVEEHNKSSRGASLVDMHTTSRSSPSSSKPDTNKPPGIWDHSRDMAVTGRLLDDAARNRVIRDAKGLGDRFGTGRSGRYM
ncbi:uncharacterized protein EI90DRAFT_3125426 [Cantharellus anzutake]|uniref:uncharacterized protein n=1 Tax=Cantharellus anzutake TaxID=1750568 RepID=UPI001906C8EB|nr:uncharacterized protein EI90DRAFT_3125426 [Cantharellus anzutake]KAF8329117.1 hypothetical protein EI90DRAFT_3125426 [Cantharellus anzutake]